MDRVVGLEGIRAQIAMLETPDGHPRLELTEFHAPRVRSATSTRRRTSRASAISRSRSTTSTQSLPAYAPTARSSSARWSATATPIGAATSAVRRTSSSSWRNRSTEGSDQPPNRIPGVSGRLEGPPLRNESSADLLLSSDGYLGAPDVGLCLRGLRGSGAVADGAARTSAVLAPADRALQV